MKAKKYTIILSSFIAIINVLLFAILQFRLYHFIGITGTGQGILPELREFFMVASSGLFTSACVTLIISIREYIDASWKSLRDLKRQLYDIGEKFKCIAWYDPKIPVEDIRKYFQHKYSKSSELFRMDIELHNEENIDLPPVLLDFLAEEQAIRNSFRNQIWEYRMKDDFPDSTPEDRIKSYIDKAFPHYENEIESRTKQFFDSLQILRYYDIYQLQATLDDIEFLFSKKMKKVIHSSVLNYFVIYIDTINNALLQLEQNANSKTQPYLSLELLNKILLHFEKDHSNAYSLAEYYVAMGIYYVDCQLYPKNKPAKPKINSYSIYYRSRPSTSLAFIRDSFNDKFL